MYNSLEITVFSNLSGDLRSKIQRKVYLQIELKSTTFVKLTCVIINCNNFCARIFNQIQIPASETSRSRGFVARCARSTCGQVYMNTCATASISKVLASTLTVVRTCYVAACCTCMACVVAMRTLVNV